MGRLRRLFGFGRAKPSEAQPRHGLFWQMAAGEAVTEATALTYSAVWAAQRLISEAWAGLPWHHFERSRDGRGRQRIETDLDYLLSTAWNPEQSAFDARQFVCSCALLWGNGYAEIERALNGSPMALWPIHPERMQPRRDDSGGIVYRVDGRVDIPANDVFHLRGPGNGLAGYSVVSMAAQSIGGGIAGDKFASAFFANGTNVSSVLTTPEMLNDEAVAGIQHSLSAFRGAKNRGKTLILDQGKKFETVGMPLADAQFLEQRRFTVEDIARWFRVPPHKIGHLERAHFNNVESLNIDFVTDSLLPWVQRGEQEAQRKLIRRDRRRRFTKMNVNGLLRGDMAGREAFYRGLFGIGALSPNDIRELEDMNPVTDGDVYLAPLNMQPLAAAAEPPQEPEPAEAPDLTPVVEEALARVEAYAVKIVTRADKAEKLEAYLSRVLPAMAGAVRRSLGMGDMGDVDCSAIAADLVDSYCCGYPVRAAEVYERLTK